MVFVSSNFNNFYNFRIFLEIENIFEFQEIFNFFFTLQDIISQKVFRTEIYFWMHHKQGKLPNKEVFVSSVFQHFGKILLYFWKFFENFLKIFLKFFFTLGDIISQKVLKSISNPFLLLELGKLPNKVVFVSSNLNNLAKFY